MVKALLRLLVIGVLLAPLMGAKPVDENQKATAKKAASDVVASSNAQQKKLSESGVTPPEISDSMKARGKALAEDPAFSQEKLIKDSEKYADEAKLMASQKASNPDIKLMDLLQEEKSVLKIDEYMQSVEGNVEQPTALYRVYVSRSMPAGQMKQILEIASNEPRMVIALRGVMPGEKIDGVVKWIMRVGAISKDGKQPNVVLDPVAFKKNNITVVPVIEKLDEKGNSIAWVRGSASTRFLNDAIANGKKGDLGKIGAVGPVVERDMIEVAKEQINVKKARNEALKKFQSFWETQKYYELPVAIADRKRLIDPSIILEEGITGPDGTVLALPGERLNPMDAMPFNMVFIVIDARSSKQVAWASMLIQKLGMRESMVVTTAMPLEDGWDYYKKTVVRLKQPLYMINSDIIERFGIEKVPSMVVDGGNKRLAVYEYDLRGAP